MIFLLVLHQVPTDMMRGSTLSLSSERLFWCLTLMSYQYNIVVYHRQPCIRILLPFVVVIFHHWLFGYTFTVSTCSRTCIHSILWCVYNSKSNYSGDHDVVVTWGRSLRASAPVSLHVHTHSSCCWRWSLSLCSQIERHQQQTPVALE